MVENIGLLTREGMEFFYPIYKDMQNWKTPDYEDPFPGVPFDEKPSGDTARTLYRQMLADVGTPKPPSASIIGATLMSEKKGLTRISQEGGKGGLIKIRAVGKHCLPFPRPVLSSFNTFSRF